MTKETVKRLFEIERKYIDTEQWDDIQFLLQLVNNQFGEIQDLKSGASGRDGTR